MALVRADLGGRVLPVMSPVKVGPNRLAVGTAHAVPMESVFAKGAGQDLHAILNVRVLKKIRIIGRAIVSATAMDGLSIPERN
mmetsp:Transcript_51516/g.83156  ORF Transcript_51516/g.83156 Transcript_51516/m.83156 type:complete len:83 (-) Transcript_51516:1949-2197(-)